MIPQTYIVRLEQLAGSGYSLAVGEQNDKPLQAIIGSTINVNFKLHKNVVGGGGGGGGPDNRYLDFAPLVDGRLSLTVLMFTNSRIPTTPSSRP